MAGVVVRCTLSGSYHADRAGLHSAYSELITCGCQVLSPHRLDFDSVETVFVRDKAEADISEVTLEEHHLVSIQQSDFLWVHAAEGHVGASTSLEIGYAIAHKIPIFSSSDIADGTLAHFIQKVPSVYKALERLNRPESSVVNS